MSFYVDKKTKKEYSNEHVLSIFNQNKNITRFKIEDIDIFINDAIGIDSIKYIEPDINIVRIKSKKTNIEVCIIENNFLDFVILHAFIEFEKKLKESCSSKVKSLLNSYTHKSIVEWKLLYLDWLLSPNEEGYSINEFLGITENAFNLLEKENPSLFTNNKRINDFNTLETLALFIESKSNLNIINFDKIEFVFSFGFTPAFYRKFISKSRKDCLNIEEEKLKRISIILTEIGLREEIYIENLLGWEWNKEDSILIIKTINSIIKLNVENGFVGKEVKR